MAASLAVLKALVEAFNAHDLDRIMGHFADDCVLEMPRGPDPWGRRYVGKAQVRDGLAARFEGGQVEPVFTGHEVENRDALERAADDIGDRIRNHNGDNDRVIPAYFKHHENRGHRCAQKPGEDRSHADERKRAERAAQPGE